MSRIRSSMVLLGICVVALLIASLRLAAQRSALPTGSSYSTDPNGAQALFDWTSMVGASPRRLQAPLLATESPPALVLVIQPERVLDDSGRAALDRVPQGGGTLVLAGDSLPWLLYARGLGVGVDPVPAASTVLATLDGGLTFSAVTRYRLRAPEATPLLVADDGAVVALRLPYQQGALVVFATPEPLLNSGLRNDAAARFVFREIVSPTSSGANIAFDEALHSYSPRAASGRAPTLNELLFSTPAGRSLMYAAGVIFVYLVLTGRRLGPALAPRPSTELRRTMFEHVQMLANLYRRAGQFRAAQAAFARHYARRLSSAGRGTATRAATLAALARIEAARTEPELVEAVAAASDAG